MRGVLEQVLADLADEGEALEAMLAPLDEPEWRTPTPAVGWDVATQIAHLAWTDEVAVAAATDSEAWTMVAADALEDPSGFVDTRALAGGRAGAEELLERWIGARTMLQHTLRAVPAGVRIPWFGPPMSPASMATARFMETWAHSLDVAQALGVAHAPTDRIRHVAHLGVRTRDFAFGVHGLSTPVEEFRIELRAPSGELWAWGPPDAPQSVRGSALDFCLRVTQRAPRDDLDLVADGPDADRWLHLAQAFAGPPGPGRRPLGEGR